MNIFIKTFSSNKHKCIYERDLLDTYIVSTKMQNEFTTLNRNNNKIPESNTSNDDVVPTPDDDDDDKYDPTNFNEDDYSIKVMHLYPLGFNKNETELNEDEISNKPPKKNLRETPRKKKIKSKEGEKEDEDEQDKSCVYNVWVPDCIRTRKDFIECQKLDMTLFDTKEKFEKELLTTKYYNSINDYDEFKSCSKHTNTRILQGVEIKFGIVIDVSDCFYSLTGAKLRAYSFQGPNRNVIYSGFSHFKGSWTDNMAVNTVTDYDMVFEPDNWYFSVIESGKKSKPLKNEANNQETVEEKKEAEVDEATNVSNRIFLSLNEESELHNFQSHDVGENLNRLDSISELEVVENANNKDKYTRSGVFSKYHNILSLCMKYFKIPKIHFKKILFSSYMNETESLSGVISKRSKVVNENNNKNPETLSFSSEHEGYTVNTNYKLVNFLIDSYNKPIPVWIKSDNGSNVSKLSDLKMIKDTYVKSIEMV